MRAFAIRAVVIRADPNALLLLRKDAMVGPRSVAAGTTHLPTVHIRLRRWHQVIQSAPVTVTCGYMWMHPGTFGCMHAIYVRSRAVACSCVRLHTVTYGGIRLHPWRCNGYLRLRVHCGYMRLRVHLSGFDPPMTHGPTEGITRADSFIGEVAPNIEGFVGRDSVALLVGGPCSQRMCRVRNDCGFTAAHWDSSELIGIRQNSLG